MRNVLFSKLNFRYLEIGSSKEFITKVGVLTLSMLCLQLACSIYSSQSLNLKIGKTISS